MNAATLPDVFQYQDPVGFLNAVLEAKQRANPRYSLRAWAKQLGLQHPSHLSMVLGGKRTLRLPLGARLRENLGLKDSRAQYFDALVQFHGSKTASEKEFYAGLLSGLRPGGEFVSLELDRFRVIADWHHIAILCLADFPGFTGDADWISRHLGRRVSRAQAAEAVGRLLRLGLLEREERSSAALAVPGVDSAKAGRLRRTSARLAVPSGNPDMGIRGFHRVMMEHAIEAQEAQPVDRRDITGHMVATRPERIARAKEMIRDFRKRLSRELECENPSVVYQLNVQLFEITEEERK